MNHQISGYNVRVWDPQVQVKALPGQGGDVPDGVELDTSKASGTYQASNLGVNLRPLLPQDAQAARISFDIQAWKSRDAPGEPPTVSSRVIECSFDERARKHYSWIFDFRWRPIEAGKHRMALAVRLHPHERRLPASEDRLVGPDFFVPAGWRLAITHWAIDVIPPSEVLPTNFPADVEDYVTIATACHRPSPIHLRW